VVVAGIPSELGDEFENSFNKRSRNKHRYEIITRRELDISRRYTESYADSLYEKLVDGLRKRLPSNRETLLATVSLVRLCLAKADGSQSILLNKFGMGILTVPLEWPCSVRKYPSTYNQRRQAVNALVRNGIRSIGYADRRLAVVSEEVTNRINKTCFLLPPKNFGNNIEHISKCVHSADLHEDSVDVFKGEIKNVSRLLKKDQNGNFVGMRGLVFKSARERHAYPPEWKQDSEHNASCVIRGRLRFGVPYDPRFHYNVDITKVRDRIFPSCHNERRLPRSRKHANIAPNDNIR